MLRRPLLIEARDFLFVVGIAASTLGLVSAAAGFHPIVGEALHAPLAPAQTLTWPPPDDQFQRSVLPLPPMASGTAVPPTPEWRGLYPGDGIGHRDAMVAMGDGPRFLRETSQLQTRRGWHDAGNVALARFMGGHVPPKSTSSASPP